MPEDALIAAIVARLDTAAVNVVQSNASVVEQHGILGDLAFAHTLLTFLAKGDPDRVAAVMEAMAVRERVRVPKTAGPAVGWSDHPRPSEMNDVERRSFLALAATVAGAPVASLLTDLPGRELVAVLQETTDRYRERLHTVPSATLFGGLIRHAAELDRRAREAREPLRSALLGVLSETAGLAGEIAFMDLGRSGDAARHFAHATDAAREAHDLDRVARSYDRVALRLQFARRPADALAVLERAARECAREPLSLLRCSLHKEQAVNLALLGQEHRALLELDEAFWHRAHADTASASPVWVEAASRLEATGGYVKSLLGRPDAEEMLVAARTRAEGDDGLQTVILAALAETAASSGEIDLAAEVATEAFALATVLESIERKRRVLRPWARLKRHQGIPAVRELGEQLRTAGIAA